MFFRKTAKTQSKMMMSYINIYILTFYMEAVTNITFSRKSKMEAVVFFLFLFFLIVNRAFTSRTQSLSYSVYHVVHWCKVSLQVGLAPNSGSFSAAFSVLV